MNTIYIVNYGADQYYSYGTGDTFYCKSLRSAKQKIISLMKGEGIRPKDITATIYPLNVHMLDRKTMMSPGSIPNLELGDLYIGLSENRLF